MSRLGFYIVRIYSTLRDALTKEEEEEEGPSVKTVNIHVYTYIFLNKYLFQKNVHIKKKYVFHINIHISVFAMRG